jgi:acetyl-CoA acetyltransferase
VQGEVLAGAGVEPNKVEHVIGGCVDQGGEQAFEVRARNQLTMDDIDVVEINERSPRSCSRGPTR